MKGLLVGLVLACVFTLLSGGIQAREATPHRSGHHVSKAHDTDAHVRHMQRLQRKHDLRKVYHDRRPRRPMRSM